MGSNAIQCILSTVAIIENASFPIVLHLSLVELSILAETLIDIDSYQSVKNVVHTLELG